MALSRDDLESCDQLLAPKKKEEWKIVQHHLQDTSNKNYGQQHTKNGNVRVSGNNSPNDNRMQSMERERKTE